MRRAEAPAPGRYPPFAAPAIAPSSAGAAPRAFARKPSPATARKAMPWHRGAEVAGEPARHRHRATDADRRQPDAHGCERAPLTVWRSDGRLRGFGEVRAGFRCSIRAASPTTAPYRWPERLRATPLPAAPLLIGEHPIERDSVLDADRQSGDSPYYAACPPAPLLGGLGHPRLVRCRPRARSPGGQPAQSVIADAGAARLWLLGGGREDGRDFLVG